MKIHKSEITGYKINDSSKVFKFTFFGLTFARFRIASVKKVDGNFIATVDIFSDEVSKEV